MDTAGEERRRSGATPEPRAEKSSTGVLTGGAEASDEAEAEGTEEPGHETRRLSEQELRELVERERLRNADPNYRNPRVPPPEYVRQPLRRLREP